MGGLSAERDKWQVSVVLYCSTNDYHIGSVQLIFGCPSEVNEVTWAISGDDRAVVVRGQWQ